jgi:hypothetical protein
MIVTELTKIQFLFTILIELKSKSIIDSSSKNIFFVPFMQNVLLIVYRIKKTLKV